MNKETAATYRRSEKSRGAGMPYEEKFAGLIDACDSCKDKGISNLIVSWPWVLGDTYEELIESLSRISDAGLVLHIVERHTPDDPCPPKITRN